MKIELSVEELKQLTEKIKISAAGTTDILNIKCDQLKNL